MWRGSAGLLAALAAAVGCGDADQTTGIILTVRSDLKVGQEIDSVHFQVKEGGVDVRRQLASNAAVAINGALTLPVQFGIRNPSHDETPATITVDALLHDDLSREAVVVSRTLRTRFRAHETVRFTVHLNRLCQSRQCAVGRTCVPGYGCISPDVDDTGQPMEARRGPPCICADHFPLCVGATWSYLDTIALNTPVPIPRTKNWAIVDFASIGDPAPTMLDERFGKTSIQAFMQVRDTSGDRSQRWITREADGSIYWHKDQWFDSHWQPSRMTYYMPRRLRIDPTEKAWPSIYEQFDFVPDKDAVQTPHRDEWRRVPFPVGGSMTEAGKKIGERYRDKGMVCHERNSGTATPTVFCFVPGVGKVYELTPDTEEEVLETATIPGCPSP
jgi:hypothetical protein